MNSISTKKYKYSDSEEIHVFDNVFSVAERNHFYEVGLNSRFMFKRGASNFPEAGSNIFQLCSLYNNEDINFLRLFKNVNLQAILKDFQIENYKLDFARVNACLSSDVYQYHVDSTVSAPWSLLYFMNLEWMPEWEGETVFAEQDRKNIFQSIAFIPGRLLLFNGSIPHKSSQPASCAPYQRFVFNARLNPPDAQQGTFVSNFTNNE